MSIAKDMTLIYDIVNDEAHFDNVIIKHEKINGNDNMKIKEKQDERYVTKYENYEHRVYEKDYKGIESIEFDIILYKKPDTSIFVWEILDMGLTYHFQPPLDEEYLDWSCNATDCKGKHRPIDIVGSYAVYESTAMGLQKLYHIYRPLVTDNDGNSIWGELYIDRGFMSIRVDVDWLKSAKYPVIIDPTIGKTDVGGSTQNAENMILGSNYVISGGPYNITSISVYVQDNSGAP